MASEKKGIETKRRELDDKAGNLKEQEERLKKADKENAKIREV